VTRVEARSFFDKLRVDTTFDRDSDWLKKRQIKLRVFTDDGVALRELLSFHQRFAHERNGMHDQALIWNTDDTLQVTTLTARLRNLAKIGSINQPLHVSGLWGEDDPFGVAVVAHHWALDGESLSFDTAIGETFYHFELEPLYNVSGKICGVAGRAIEAQPNGHVRSDVLREAEHVAGIGTWHEDLRTGMVTISEGLTTLLGIPNDSKSLDIRSFDHPDDRALIAATIIAQSDERGYRCDHRIVSAGSRIRSVRERVRTLTDERGVPISRIGTLTDISDLKEREAALTDLVHYDPLTGLPNRTLLEERLNASLAANRNSDRRTAVFFLDLDTFKVVNDTHGHQFGDRLLSCVGERLSRYVRASDMVARLSGDEFVIVIDDLYNDDAALDAARKIMRSFYDPFALDSKTVAVSASIGVATFPTAGSTASELIAAADREMYVVKHNGGRGVKLFQPSRERTEVAEANTNACVPHSSQGQPHYVTQQSA
jgi:diguanylate cyclase (GGDEF)-like protein